MKPVILFRKSLSSEYEMSIASKYFEVYEYRNSIPKNSLVVGRYSTLPYYKELQNDLWYKDSKLINSWFEHEWIADVGTWYEDLKQFTFLTIPFEHFYKQPDLGYSWVVKGQTNSKKDFWKTKMFAATNKEVATIANSLMDDSLICSQKLYVRKFEKLKTFCHGINGQPITEEYRFFCYKDKIITGGFYWSNHLSQVLGETDFVPDHNNVPKEYLKQIMDICKEHANFYVLDIARKDDGNWILVEVNDGQFSGLSECNADELYSNLSKELNHEII